jgi:hypothetical protein
MSGGIRRCLVGVAFALGVLGSPWAAAQAGVQPAPVPKHLALARELVDHVRPENNRYEHSESISFPGDFLSNKYAMHADCSGFVLALFDRAGYTTVRHMGYLYSTSFRHRPQSEDFLYSIERGYGFRPVTNVRDAQPGDVLAQALLDYGDQRDSKSTGHTQLIDSVPRPIAARAPLVDGTQQFEVIVIDSSEGWGGPDDTRLADPAHKVKGLGRVTIRLYADADGRLVGWARTFPKTNRFFSFDPRFPSDTKVRRAAIGRPVADG